LRLGQNFLADPNLLDAIVRESETKPDDVVLEVGAGEGVLTERLAEVARHVHAVEIDHGLDAALAGIASRGGVTLHWGDAMKMDLAAFDPAPTVMVANLPYSVATPVILRTEEALPALRRWTVMVQREIADRLRAEPGSRTYGAPTAVLGQSARVSMLRPVDAAVFRPRPRVASAVLRIDRTGPPADAATRALIRDAFAHRRKSLARSLEIARPGRLRAAREALEELGLPADSRAERLSPAEFSELARRIGS
jgi:16S rRNA (adenine1518-N6/adenine1519-N6)-dimethyltransferase